MIEYKYDIDMTQGRPPLEIKMKQYDTDFVIIFSLVDWIGDLELETETTAKIRGTKADGYGYSENATVDIANKTITVQGDEQMTIVPGKQPFELAIMKGTKLLNTATFYLNISPAALSDDADMSESDLSDFRQAINAAQQAAASAVQSGNSAAAASGSATAAANSAAAAAQSAIDAAAVFSLAGDVSFVILENRKVRMYFTENN